MLLTQFPAQWNSVHRPIEYVYDYDKITTCTAGVSNNLGLARFGIAAFSGYTPAPGDTIHVVSGKYRGTHKVTHYAAIPSISVLTVDTPYVGNATGFKIKRAENIPQMELYSGYLPGEEHPAELPLQLIATFTPENAPDFTIRIDVSEYLKSIFTIHPPAVGIDYNMFNRFRLRFNGEYKTPYMVLNSSIKTEELNAKYTNTNAALSSIQPPFMFGCGKTIISYLSGNMIINQHITDADDSDGDFGDDFSEDDFGG